MSDEEILIASYDTEEWQSVANLPAEQATYQAYARATFLAQLHRTPGVEEWLRRVIQERVELEEAAFVGIKRSLAARTA